MAQTGKLQIVVYNVQWICDAKQMAGVLNSKNLTFCFVVRFFLMLMSHYPLMFF